MKKMYGRIPVQVVILEKALLLSVVVMKLVTSPQKIK